MFNEYEVFQIIKNRQEEIEKNARDAWKYQNLEQETLFQKVLKTIKPSKKIQKPVHGKCACHC